MKAGSIIKAFALLAVVMLASLPALAQMDAAAAFGKMSSDLKAKSKTMSQYEYTGAAEKAMLDFLKRYPRSAEAAQAHYNLGRLYSSTGEHEKSIRHFRAYLDYPGDKGGATAIAQAKYVMGSSYLALDRFDEADRTFREISKGGAVDSRISEGAAGELARIAALRKLAIGAPAVEIAGTSSDGKQISLKKLRGKVVLVDFWAAWCNPCRQEMPNVIRIYNEFNKKGFEIVGVSLDNDKAQFQGYLKENRLPWPQLFDGKGWQSSVGQSYAVNSIPATFLIDRKGNIRFKNVRGDKLRTAVQQLLAEK